ncbi:diaminopimelate decarboxylase [Acidithiobacillus sp.]|uniref:diaminopimelate decarboxylase n=1 Tax=Acidithiobacillus sp. TaxID=1872118 RepID=UPI0025BC29A2|nr:diaminopimelate decarboxylase [Acidithiobacillus sp.]
MNTPFHYRGDQLYVEDLPLAELAERFATPSYVYSESYLRQRYQAFSHALGPETMLCYAVKANSNLSILHRLATLGAGFDIVSGGELARVLRAGGDAARVVFSGVGKSRDELRRALEAGIHCINVESPAELARIEQVAAELGCRAPIALRVNPDVEAGAHPYIATGLRETKFGIPMAEAPELYARAARSPQLRVLGVACHIGSQLLDLAPIGEAAQRVLRLYETLVQRGIHLEHLDLGGGVGIRYRDEQAPTPADYAATLDAALGGLPVRRVVELGRALVGNAGALLTRVEYRKYNGSRAFCVVDAAMNDLLRPSLYGAWHEIWPLERRSGPEEPMDVVGPVCESGDFFAKARPLPGDLREGDVLAILGAGAYGFAMSSQYNSRPRAAEILVHGAEARVIRRRETLGELWAAEEPCS